MKLASINNGTRDGQLVVVSRDLAHAVAAGDQYPTMQSALDDWKTASDYLSSLYNELNEGKLGDTIDFASANLMAPLPRGFHWVDGSAYVTHVELVRKARNAELPERFWTDPLVYMGASDAFISAHDDILVENTEWGVDFESEVAVITDDVPAGVSPEEALAHIKMITILNDITLRNLIPNELSKQFGFYQSKPWTAFAPVFATPDELGDAWKDGKVHLPIVSTLNGTQLGAPNAGIDMTFDFGRLISHAAKSRSLMAGTIVGSGTVANQGSPTGSSCLAEIRCLEIIADGKPSTPFMSYGDRVQIDMYDADGASIFGKIDQVIAEYNK